MNSDSLLLVHTTCQDPSSARALAETLVAEHLAACASVGAAVESVFPWDGAVQRETETPLQLKTTRAAFDALQRRLHALHDYDVPELLAVPVVEQSATYADWVRAWVDDREPEKRQ